MVTKRRLPAIETLVKAPLWGQLARFEGWLSIALITLVGLVTYLPWMGSLGFYWEDLYVIWAGLSQGADFFIPLYAGERPLVGYLYRLIYPLLGNTPFPWQIYALIVRILGALAFFWLLRMVWPREKLATTMTAIFYLVYPGFLQQPQATTFQFHLVPLMLALFSMALSIYATQVKNPVLKILALAIAVVTAALYIMIIEYYIGLEAIRIFFLWLVIRRDTSKSMGKDLGRMISYLAPFILSAATFLVWRLFIFKSTRAATDVGRLILTYSLAGWRTFYSFGVELARDVLETVWLAWTVPLERFLYVSSYQELLLGVLLALLAMGLALSYYLLIKPSGSAEQPTPQSAGVYKAMLWGGALAFTIGLSPAILANRGVRFDFFNRLDRYTLPGSIGAVLFLCGVVFIGLKPRYRMWVFAPLLAFVVLAHYNYSVYMRDFWELERQVWWQLSWRAPQIKSPTVLFLNLPEPYGIDGDAEVWAPANIIYYPEPGNPPITADVLTRQTVFQIFQGIKKPRSYRNIWLNRNYANPLVMSMAHLGSCLNVIDGTRYELSSDEDPLVRLAAPYSKINRIQTGEPFQQPAAMVFGSEPPHTWCYYYQKATYARQVGDWETIARLGDEARENGYSAGDVSEWMVFLEGYASVGREAEAEEIAGMIRKNQIVQYDICQQLATSLDHPQGYPYDKVVELLCAPQAGE